LCIITVSSSANYDVSFLYTKLNDARKRVNNFSLNQTYEFYQIINSENKLLQLKRKHEGSIQMQKQQNGGVIRAMSEEN